MKSIIQRSLTGTVYVSLILLSVLLHPIALKVMTLVINLIALIEFDRICRKLEIQFSRIWIIVNMLLVLTELLFMQMGWFKQLGLIPLLVYFIFILILSLYQNKGNPVYNAAFSLYGSLLITLPLVLLNLIHEISIREAIPYTLAIFIFIWTNDTFAYLAGISLGRHKLFEKISPKKSWEGFFGGLIMVIAAALLMNRFFPLAGLANWIVFALLTALASVFGDFSESLLKRMAGVKDSGSILPGHGGMLDRIDSLLFASPVIYIYLIIFYSTLK
jgi:phosphatidate cytidylyltransferase